MAITDLEPRLLVEAHNAGDDQAFALIVRTHHQSLFAHAVSRLRDVQAAEDAVQETFVRAYRAMPRFRGDFHLRAWLHRILTNVCHDEGARRQRDVKLFDLVSSQVAVEVDPVDVDLDRMDVSRDVVAAALDSLPTSYREALTLRYVQELSYEEVAAATGVTEGNARVRVMRGRAALKRALTSSHAIVIAVVPWLRRDGKGIADLPSLGASASASSVSAASSSNLLSSAPLVLRAMDSAPQVAERAASLPQVIGMIAAMTVPIALPVVGDRVAGWPANRPAAVAAPADTDVAAAGATEGVSGAVPTSVPGSSTTTTTVDPSVAAAAAAAATSLEGSTTSTSMAPTTSTTTPAAPATPPAKADTGGTITAPAAAPAFSSGLSGSQITSVGDPRTDLAGAIAWGDESTRVAGQLSGTLVFDRPATGEAPPPDDGGEPPADDGGEPPADDGGDPAATDASAEPAPEQRRFTGELSLALDDGRRYLLRLTDGTLDAPEVGTATTARFDLVDACDSIIATGFVTGSMDLQQAPTPSTLDLAFDGEVAAEVPTCG